MTNKELKEKLAEFAGFKYEPDLPYYYDEIEGSEDGSYLVHKRQVGYWTKDDAAYRELPDFPNDLTALFRHVVPKLNFWTITNERCCFGWCKADIGWHEGKDKKHMGWRYGVAEAEVPAIALCKAIVQSFE